MSPTQDLSMRHLPSTSMSLSDVSDTSFSFQIPTATGEEENLLSSQAGFEFFKGMAEPDLTLADLPQHSAAAAADLETAEKQEHDFGEMGVGPTSRRNPRRRARDTLTTSPTKKPEPLALTSTVATPTRIPTGRDLPLTPTTIQRSSAKPPSKIARRISTSKPPSTSHITTQTATATNQAPPTSRSHIRQSSAQPPSTSTAFTSSQPHIPPPADADGDTPSDRRASGADDRILDAWQRTTTTSSLIPAVVVPNTQAGLDPPLSPATDHPPASTTTSATLNTARDVSSDPDPNSPLPLPLISVANSTSNSTSVAARGAAPESTIAMDPRFDFSLNDRVPSPTLVSTPAVQADGDMGDQDDSTLPRNGLIPYPDGGTLDPVVSSSSWSPLNLPPTFRGMEDQGTEAQAPISVAGSKMGMEGAVTVKPGRTRVQRAKRKTLQSGGSSSDVATPIAEVTLSSGGGGGSSATQVKDASRKDVNALILRVESTSRTLLEGDSHVSSSTGHSSSTLNGLPPVASRSRSRSGGAQAPVHGRVAKARISDRKKSQAQQLPVHDAGRKGVIGLRNGKASHAATSVEAGVGAVVVDKTILTLESQRAASSSSSSVSLFRRVSSESRQESNEIPMANLPSDSQEKVVSSKELEVLDWPGTEVVEKTDPGRAAGEMDLNVGPVVDDGSGLCSDRTTRRQSLRLRRGGQKPTQESGPARKREGPTPPPRMCPAETEVGPKRTGSALAEERASKRQRTGTKKVAIPNFAAMHAAQEARIAAVRGKGRATRAVGPVLSTDRRAREREAFDAQLRKREQELEALREQRRLEEEAAEAEAIAELRRRAVPRANSVPEWYCSRPKREKRV